MKKFVYTTTARNTGETGSVVICQEIIMERFPRAADLKVGEEIVLDEEEVGYTDFQNFITTIRRIV